METLSEMLDNKDNSSLSTMLNQAMCLNEMAQINLKETGKKKSNLDSNTYYVYVKGEGGYKKYPHFHIKHKANGWDIRMNMNGTFHSIKTKGRGMQTSTDAHRIEQIAKLWVKEKNILEPDRTNGQVAEITWYRQNS